jgi:hypothetical protein
VGRLETQVLQDFICGHGLFKAEPQTSALEPIIGTTLLGSLTATYIEFNG